MQLIKRTAVACTIALLALGAAGVADHASAQNLLMNPGFESGDLTNWLVFGQSANSDVVVLADDNGPSWPGQHYAYMENRAEAIGLTLKQSTAAGSAGVGEVFYAYDLKLDEAEIGGVLFVEIFAEQAGGGVIGGSGLIGPLFPWDWTAYSGSFIAPAGTNFLTIQFVAATGATPGSTCVVRVDNVELTYGEVPTESTTWSDTKALYR